MCTKTFISMFILVSFIKERIISKCQQNQYWNIYTMEYHITMKTIATCYNTDDLPENTERKKPAPKEYILNDSIYVKLKTG